MYIKKNLEVTKPSVNYKFQYKFVSIQSVIFKKKN